MKYDNAVNSVFTMQPCFVVLSGEDRIKSRVPITTMTFYRKFLVSSLCCNSSQWWYLK